MKNIFLMMFIFVSTILANPKTYIINHSGLLDERAYIKINSIGQELENKANVQVYLDIKGSVKIDIRLPREQRFKLIKEIEENLLKTVSANTKKDFIILTMAIDQHYTNLLYSNDKLKEIVSKDEILNEYVIPLLSSQDKNIIKSKVSAASLNGYAQIADLLADNKGIELESSIGSAGKVVSEIWKVFMYTMFFIGIIAYTYVIMREKKAKKSE